MPVALKRKGRPTKTLRYDFYAHERRDARLVKHLAEFENEDRGRNAEMKRLMYAGLDCEQQAPPAPQMTLKQAFQPEPLPLEFDDEPTTVRSKLKRAFG